jgi:hypothetical protein
MTAAEIILKYLEVLVWPATLTLILLRYRDPILSLLQKSKIKLSLYGVEVETTLSELETITLATLGGNLDNKQLELLVHIANEGRISYGKEGIPKDDREWIRPVMNAGLIMTTPQGARVGEAEGLALTPLGSLLMRAKMKKVQ